MAKITIDGETIEVAEGEMLLPAALEHGVHIPHYCWHPKLSVDGSCRMCQVDIEGAPKLSIACNTPVRDGMVVHTKSEKVEAARKGVMELLLVNHPLDCPICDKAGECLLQDYSYSYGSNESQSSETRRKLEKRKDIGPRIFLDQERCILCRRCVRFCREITGTSELSVFNLGHTSVLDVLDDQPLANDYSVNVADICPVGALTSKDFHHKLRVWFLKKTPSVCPKCANGCNVTVQHYRDRVWRVMPRRNDAVNDTWMCDHGREGYDYLSAADRLRQPLVRRGAALAEAGWDEAFDTAATRLREIARGHGPAAIGAIASAHLANEENYRFAQILTAVGTDRVGLPVPMGPSDDLLIKAEKAPNARGARDLGLAANGGDGARDLLSAAAAGELKALYVCGSDILRLEDADLIDRALAKLELLIVQDLTLSPLGERAHVVLPSLSFVEKEGTFTNHAGRVQRFHKAWESPEGQLGDGEIFSQILGRLAEAPRVYDASAVFDEIAATHADYAGLSYDSLGSAGVETAAAPAQPGEGRAL